MKPESQREEFRRPFSDLRREDEGRVPPFARVWQAATGRRAAPRPRAAWGLAAALLLVVLGAAAVVVHLWPAREQGSEPPPPVALSAPGEADAAVLAISQWRSPTEFLLEPPASAPR